MPIKPASILKFGKIELSSDSTSIWELADVLGKIIEKHGYPEKESEEKMGELLSKAMDDAKKEMENKQLLEEGKREMKDLDLKQSERKWEVGRAI